MVKRATNTARDTRDPGWFWADNDVIDHYGAKVGATGIAVYMALARFADKQGKAFPSHRALAALLGLSRNTVKAALDKLAEAELITIAEQMVSGRAERTVNEYTLVNLSHRKHDQPAIGGSAIDPRGLTTDPPPGSTIDPRGSTIAPEGHDPLLDTNLPPPPPCATGNQIPPGGGGEFVSTKEGAVRTELYHWLRANGVDSPEAAERNQHHDMAATQALYKRMVGSAIGDDRSRKIGRFIKALDRDGPPEPPRPVTAADYAPPRPVEDTLSPADRARLMREAHARKNLTR